MDHDQDDTNNFENDDDVPKSLDHVAVAWLKAALSCCTVHVLPGRIKLALALAFVDVAPEGHHPHTTWHLEVKTNSFQMSMSYLALQVE